MADDEYSFLTPRSHQEDQAHGQGVTMAKRPRLSEEGRVSVLDALVSGPEAEDTLTSGLSSSPPSLPLLCQQTANQTAKWEEPIPPTSTANL